MNGDDGVTLLELMVCIAISSIIVTALTASFFASTRAIQELEPADGRHPRCSDGEPVLHQRRRRAPARSRRDTDGACGGGSALITFTWFGWSSNNAVLRSASYFVQPQDGEQQLVRTFCDGTDPATTVVIAHNLVDRPTVKCLPPSGGEDGIACDDPTVATAQLSGTAKSDPTDAFSLPYVLRATRRAP